MTDMRRTERNKSALTDMERAVRLAKQIRETVEQLLGPMDHEMRILGMKPEMQAIIWDAVMIGAAERKDKCQ